MRKNHLPVIFLMLISMPCLSQSLEIMAGHERIFVDAQWLKFIDTTYNWSLFSRTRSTVDYDNQTDLFSGAYLNYTLSNGVGGSLVGKIGNSGAGADVGVHIFKAKSNWMLFGLASVGLKNDLEYSWFSILRFSPTINEKWRLYTSLELFSLFGSVTHLISVQRLRLGLDDQRIQWGVAANFTEFGKDWTSDSNIGVFIRKSF